MGMFGPNLEADLQQKLKNSRKGILLNNELIKYTLNSHVKINRFNFN